MRIKVLFGLLTCFLCTKQLCCQKYMPSNGVIILGGDKSKLYVDNNHTIIISSDKDFINDFIVTASQGNLERYDTLKKPVRDLMYLLSDLKSGKVVVTVSKASSTGLQVLNKRTFTIINKPLTKEEQNTLQTNVKPEVTLAGYKSDSIPFSVFKTATKLDINKPYKLQSAVFMVDGIKISHPSITVLKSEEFDEEFKERWSRVKSVKDIIIGFDEIKVIDPSGKVYAVKSLWFKLTEN